MLSVAKSDHCSWIGFLQFGIAYCEDIAGKEAAWKLLSLVFYILVLVLLQSVSYSHVVDR